MTQPLRTPLRLLALLCAAGAMLPARAADTEPAPAPAAARDVLAGARALVAKSNWPGAIAELQRVNDTRSADWHNLMGYAHRKQATPDLATAERHYDEALRLNPQHRGALEYSGELYLMKGDLARAQARLQALDKACAASCEEYVDLKKAVAAYQANGNRPVKAP